LEFNMSNIPTSWGNKNIDGKIPTDINNGAVGYDVFASDDSNIAAAIDNDATTSVTFNGNNVSLQWDATLSGTNALTINMFTITSAFDYQKFNKIQLLGSDNGNKWTSLCSVNNQLFQYRYQTKQYSFDTTKNYNHYKLVLVMDTNVQLAEVQLLTSDYIPHHKNSNNNTLWIVLGTVGALVVAGGIALAITIPLRIRKKRQTKLEN
jgi:hypothetical protein